MNEDSTKPDLSPIDHVDRYLMALLDRRALAPSLRKAIRYVLEGPGKRMRPLLVIRCCEALGGDIDRALPPAGAIELIHNFSLVHDDLPAMDDDDLRRGRPTLHKHTNEAMAVLAGDAMTSLAFELLVEDSGNDGTSTKLVAELSFATTQMISGQVYDTLGGFDGESTPLDRLHTIHRHKTAALLRSACRMGAIAADADEAGLQAVSDYGDAIGLMFQVVDDLLDVTQTTEHLGKTAGKDQAQQKLTFPSLLGLEESRRQVFELQQKAHEAIDRLGTKGSEAAEELRKLCDYMAVRSR